jgi:2-isopropylmalate synthase
MQQIKFFDTTLRDGEQAPGFAMKTEEKIALALQLERLGVDIIEAGFPISSLGDFEAVQRVAAVLTKATTTGLSRANRKDIERAWEALKLAAKPRLHIVIATSDIHLIHKLRKSREEVLNIAVDAISYAKSLTDDVEFSAEDAIRSDPDYLCQVFKAVIDAGATTVNIPDTVGYTTPDEFYERVSYVIKNVPNIDKAAVSVHCHNDLGLAVANSLAAIRAGATQVECTMNGIGERAGNAALEEIVMMLNVRKDIFNEVSHGINTKEIYRTSRLLTSITGIECQPNKAIVGKNAFSHESGIHQDGVLKNPFTYEIMTPESVGFPGNKIVLGKHSGRHAFVTRLKSLGYEFESEKIDKLFEEFKELADKKKEVFDEDLDVLVNKTFVQDFPTAYRLGYIFFSSGNTHIPTATVTLADSDGLERTEASTGDGPVDAAFRAIEKISGITSKLSSYRISALTEGKDAQGEVVLMVGFSGEEPISGKGYSTDVVVASVHAYVAALNRYINRRSHGGGQGDKGCFKGV